MTLFVLILGIVAALSMVLALSRDAAYALSAGSPATLGDLANVSAAALAEHDNRTVAADGLLGVVGALRYERPLRESTFRVLPVLGRLDIWVEVRVPPGEEGGRWEPPRSFAGRLERLDGSGVSHRGLKDAIKQVTHVPLPGKVWLIVDGDEPAQARWSLVLMTVFLACAMWNAASIARIVRKVAT